MPDNSTFDSPRITDPGGTPTRAAGLPQLVVLLAGSCMSVLGAVLIAPVLPQMAEHFAGVPGVDVLVPIVLTVPALLIGLTAPFAGLIVDEVDRKRLLLDRDGRLLDLRHRPAVPDSLGAIIGSRVLVGICEAAIMTCCTTLIGDYWSGAAPQPSTSACRPWSPRSSATVFLGRRRRARRVRLADPVLAVPHRRCCSSCRWPGCSGSPPGRRRDPARGAASSRCRGGSCSAPAWSPCSAASSSTP